MQTNDEVEAIVFNPHEITIIALVIATKRLSKLVGKPQRNLTPHLSPSK